MLNSKEKIRQIIANDSDGFMNDFLNLDTRNGRASECPYCGQKHTFAYNKRNGMFGCFYSGCESIWGDAIDVSIIINKCGGDPYAFKSLDKETKKIYFKETMADLESFYSKEIDNIDQVDEKFKTRQIVSEEKVELKELPSFVSIYKDYCLEKGIKGSVQTDFCKSTWRRFNKETLEEFRIFDATDKASDVVKGFHYYSIWDENGRLVGAQGRKKYDDEFKDLPEYKQNFYKAFEKAFNFPNVEKSKMIFGLWQILQRKKEVRSLVLHEGPADVCRSFEFGAKNTVSCLGCKVSAYQVELLYKAFGDIPIAIFFDNDHAGRVGALASYEKLSRRFTKIFFCTLETSNDADSSSKEEYVNALKRPVKMDARFIKELKTKIEEEESNS